MKRIFQEFSVALKCCRGQTMTEYALILSAVAVVVYLGYQSMGGDITSLMGSIDNQL